MPWSPVPTPTANRGPLMRMMHDTDGVGYAARRAKETLQQYNPRPNKLSTEEVTTIYALLDSINYKDMPAALDKDLTVSGYFKFTLKKSAYDKVEDSLGLRDPKFANVNFLENYKVPNAHAYADDFNHNTCTVCEGPWS